MAANKFIAEVDAPEFGEGFTIRLDMHGQGILETEFGAFEFAGKIGYGLALLSATYMLAFLKVSLRGPDGAVVKELPEIAPPIDPIARKCLDAFALFRYGQTHEEWVAANENEQSKKKDDFEGHESLTVYALFCALRAGVSESNFWSMTWNNIEIAVRAWSENMSRLAWRTAYYQRIDHKQLPKTENAIFAKPRQTLAQQYAMAKLITKVMH